MNRFVLALAAALTFAPPALAQGIRYDGDWSITMSMTVDGRAMETTTRQCVTKELAADPMSSIPGGPEAKRGCAMSDYKVTGRAVVWTMKCEGTPPILTKGEYVYATDSYVGTMTMSRGPQTIVTKLTGTRLGDCTNPATTKP